MSDYINNKELEETIKFYLKNRDNKEIEDKLMGLIQLFAKELSNKLDQIIPYPDKEEKEAAIISKCWTVLKDWKARKGSAFTFLTTCAWNEIRQLYKKEIRHERIKLSYKLNLWPQYKNDNITNEIESNNIKNNQEVYELYKSICTAKPRVTGERKQSSKHIKSNSKSNITSSKRRPKKLNHKKSKNKQKLSHKKAKVKSKRAGTVVKRNKGSL